MEAVRVTGIEKDRIHKAEARKRLAVLCVTSSVHGMVPPPTPAPAHPPTLFSPWMQWASLNRDHEPKSTLTSGAASVGLQDLINRTVGFHVKEAPCFLEQYAA